MPFHPLNTNHAIESAVFAIKFARPFTPAEWQVIDDNHQKWLNILPAVHFDSGKNLGAFLAFSSLRELFRGKWLCKKAI